MSAAGGDADRGPVVVGLAVRLQRRLVRHRRTAAPMQGKADFLAIKQCLSCSRKSAAARRAVLPHCVLARSGSCRSQPRVHAHTNHPRPTRLHNDHACGCTRAQYRSHEPHDDGREIKPAAQDPSHDDGYQNTNTAAAHHAALLLRYGGPGSTDTTTGAASRRRDCHFADVTPPVLLKHLIKVEGDAAE